MRHVAIPIATGGAFTIAQLDADGIGTQRLVVGVTNAQPSEEDCAGAAAAARLLVMAYSLPDGIDGALAILRAQLARAS